MMGGGILEDQQVHEEWVVNIACGYYKPRTVYGEWGDKVHDFLDEVQNQLPSTPHLGSFLQH